MKRKLLILILLLFPCVVNAESVKFVRCVDGDTAVVKIDKEEKKIRFLAVDTPETKHPAKGKEAGGETASEYTCYKLKNAKKLEIEYDPKSNKEDKYGRTLVWLYVDGELFQKDLISNGYAEVAYIYGKYNYVDELCSLQKEAINNKLGIWNDGTRKEGYCSAGSTSNNTKTTKKTVSKTVLDYILEGKFDKALDVAIHDKAFIPIIIILLIMFVSFVTGKTRKRRK